MKIINIYISLILFCMYCVAPQAVVYAGDYGIIRGEQVNLREKDDVNSKIIRLLNNGELIYFIKKTNVKIKIGNDFEYWINIKTYDGKIGWVYGKYFYDYSDNEDLHKAFIKIIPMEMKYPYRDPKLPTGGRLIIDVKFEIDNSKRYIIFHFKSYLDNLPLDKAMFFYVNEGVAYKKVIETGPDNGNFIVTKNHILIWDRFSIEIYEITNLMDKPDNDNEKKFYKRSKSLHIRKGDFVKPINDSYLDFDPTTLIATMHLRDTKDAPMRLEKYAFKKGKFELIK